jgi:hypothetical protein
MMPKPQVEYRLLCERCNSGIGLLELEASSDLSWLSLKCPHCQCEIAHVLARDVNNPPSLSYQRFVIALEGIVRVDTKLRSAALKQFKHQAGLKLAGVVLSPENVRHVKDEVFSRRSAAELEESVRKGVV